MKAIAKLKTFVDIVRARSDVDRDEAAFTFYGETDSIFERLTYEELDRRARALAATLQENHVSGGRAVLLFQPGMDYIVSVYGCFYAGVVAVPVFTPRPGGSFKRIRQVVENSGATIVLTNEMILGLVKMVGIDKQVPHIRWVTSESISIDSADHWVRPDINEDSLALLQYTSGSTGDPKGVMLAHRHLVGNAEMIRTGMKLSTEETVPVFWLPPYHDMGLIGGILTPSYVGLHSHLMSPDSFLQRPLRWLNMITREGGTTSAAPNFAYDLCVKRVTLEQREKLDLSTWKIALNGAEPVNASTLKRFVEYFEPAGFKMSTFFPAYGLAEATVFVAGSDPDKGAHIACLSIKELEHKHLAHATDPVNGREIVSSGYGADSVKIRIVDPSNHKRCHDGKIGEIWVRSNAVAFGYWGRDFETHHTFEAKLHEDAADEPYMRTGDLGGFLDGELYVTGRIKDLIIIRGQNHYPHDIEATVMASHPALRPGGGVAFSVSQYTGEQLVIVQEMDRKAGPDVNYPEVEAAIHAAVSHFHQLKVACLVLVAPGSVPKTSSGKVQRSQCKELLLDGELTPLNDVEIIVPAEAD